MFPRNNSYSCGSLIYSLKNLLSYVLIFRPNFSTFLRSLLSIIDVMEDLGVYVNSYIWWHSHYDDVPRRSAQIANCILRVLKYICIENYPKVLAAYWRPYRENLAKFCRPSENYFVNLSSLIMSCGFFFFFSFGNSMLSQNSARFALIFQGR